MAVGTALLIAMHTDCLSQNGTRVLRAYLPAAPGAAITAHLLACKIDCQQA